MTGGHRPDKVAALFADEKDVAQASDTRISADTVPAVSMIGATGTGTARILGARFYALP